MLSHGDTVRVHNGVDWSRKAKIVENHKNDTSYAIETEKGTLIRRNQKHLMPTKENFEHSPPEDLAFGVPTSEVPTTEKNLLETEAVEKQMMNKLLQRSPDLGE